MPDNSVPYAGFVFTVEFDERLIGGFSEVTGLEGNVETLDFEEGGMNGFVHKLPKSVKYPNLVLKRGVGKSDFFWKWYYSTLTGNVQRKLITVYLWDRDRSRQVWIWKFSDAYPVKWTGPNLKAGSGDVAIEALEIVHSGMIAEML